MPRAKKATNDESGSCGNVSNEHQTVTVCMRKTGKPSVGQVGAPFEVCKVLRDQGMATADRERMLALHLDTRNNIIGIEEVAKGTLTGVDAHPRELFKGAILNNAASIILAHNHPSGDPSPSPQDEAMTRRLVGAGTLLGISLLDHVVVGADTCFSFHNRKPSVFAGAAASLGTYNPKSVPLRRKRRLRK